MRNYVDVIEIQGILCIRNGKMAVRQMGLRKIMIVLNLIWKYPFELMMTFSGNKTKRLVGLSSEKGQKNVTTMK